MKNRYIPFGYQIQNGDSVINTEQAATVQHIFYAYTEGQSFKEIAEYLTTCVNRLEYGTKFCSHSPSIPEEELHQAILKAVQNLAANFTDEVAAQLDGILRQMKAGENLKAQLQKQLEKAQQEFDRLLEMSLELDESTPFLDDKLRKLSGKIKILKANIAESTDGKGEDEEATKQLTAQDLLIKEYDDILTARIIEKVIVHSRQEIEIYFIGGYTQKIDLI